MRTSGACSRFPVYNAACSFKVLSSAYALIRKFPNSVGNMASGAVVVLSGGVTR